MLRLDPRPARLTDAILAAGIPITGLSGEPGRIELTADNTHLTAEQRRQAEAMIAAFDWTEPKPLRPRAVLRQAIEALTATERNKLRDAVLFELLLDLIETDADRVQSLVSRLNLTLPIRETAP